MRRSRIVQTLNGDPVTSPLSGAHRLSAPYSSHLAPQRVRLGSSLAAALLDSPFEQPANLAGIFRDFLQPRVLRAHNSFQHPARFVRMFSNVGVASLNALPYDKSTSQYFARCRLARDKCVLARWGGRVSWTF